MNQSATTIETIDDFFARYTGYLTDGDLDGLADIYNYPALAVTAQGCLAITDPQQTRDFFAQGRAFYHSRGIHRVRARDITTDAEVPGVWVGRLVLQNYDADDQPVDARAERLPGGHRPRRPPPDRGHHAAGRVRRTRPHGLNTASSTARLSALSETAGGKNSLATSPVGS